MPTATSSSDNPPQLNKQDAADLFAINGMLDTLRNHLPEEPYILTIPQNVTDKYGHPNSYQASQWLYQAPFKRGEDWEGLQYQTWEYHDPMNPMFVQRTHMEVEGLYSSSSQRQERQRASTPITGANTPSGSVKPKNVLSFAAYKNKKDGTPLPEDVAAKKLEDAKRRDAVKGPMERVKAETEEVLAAARDVQDDDEHTHAKEAKKMGSQQQSNELKRKRPQVEQRDSKDAEQGTETVPAAKKPRKSTASSGPSESKQLVGKVHDEPKQDRKPSPRSSPPAIIATDVGMPPKLSPLQSVPDMPARLSPTIPANILATIAKKKKSTSSEDTSAPSSSSKTEKNLTPTKRMDDVRKHVSPVPRNGFRAGSQTGSPAPTSRAPAIQPPDASPAEDRVKVSDSSAPYKKRSLIVKLKIKKSIRENVRRLLKVAAKPKKSIRADSNARVVDEAANETYLERRNSERRQAGAKGVAQKIGPATTPTTKNKREDELQKRAKANDEQDDQSNKKRKKFIDDSHENTSSAKRRKVPEPLDAQNEPSTPAQVKHLSPSASIQKSNQVTPSVRKDVLSAALQQREQSFDSIQNTPSLRPDTPASGAQVNGAMSRVSSNQPSEKTPLQQAWEKEQSRLQKLGRDLKHAAQAHMTASQSATSPRRDKMLAAAVCLECMLTFVLTFVSADQACEAADPRMPPIYGNWETLYSFVNFVKSYCKSVPLLDGVASLMSVTALSRLVSVSGRISEEKGPKREDLLKFQGRLLSSATDAEAKLGLELLQEAFPKTWERRAKTGVPEADKIRPGQFAGPYVLPIGVQTSPLRAVRAGCSMLQEWIEKEGLDHKMKLKV